MIQLYTCKCFVTAKSLNFSRLRHKINCTIEMNIVEKVRADEQHYWSSQSIKHNEKLSVSSSDMCEGLLDAAEAVSGTRQLFNGCVIGFQQVVCGSCHSYNTLFDALTSLACIKRGMKQAMFFSHETHVLEFIFMNPFRSHSHNLIFIPKNKAL